MPNMDGTGPERKGQKTGRGLGRCGANNPDLNNEQLGKGLGLRRRAGGGKGNAKRLNSGIKQ